MTATSKNSIWCCAQHRIVRINSNSYFINSSITVFDFHKLQKFSQCHGLHHFPHLIAGKAGVSLPASDDFSLSESPFRFFPAAIRKSWARDPVIRIYWARCHKGDADWFLVSRLRSSGEYIWSTSLLSCTSPPSSSDNFYNVVDIISIFMPLLMIIAILYCCWLVNIIHEFSHLYTHFPIWKSTCMQAHTQKEREETLMYVYIFASSSIKHGSVEVMQLKLMICSNLACHKEWS